MSVRLTTERYHISNDCSASWNLPVKENLFEVFKRYLIKIGYNLKRSRIVVVVT